MARIHVIDAGEADGLLREVYDELTKSRGKLAEVHKIQSLNPQSIRDHMALYKTTMFAKSPLSRAERAMMAVVVSATNRCRYCVAHHGEALLHFWKDRERVDGLAADRAEFTGLSPREILLCRYAQVVTEQPDSNAAARLIVDLRADGLDDRAILDATLVISYFNFVNRMVLALGVDLEPDAGGYEYE